MTIFSTDVGDNAMASGQRPILDDFSGVLRGLSRGSLFWKYVVLFVSVMGIALLANSLINIWFTYREHRASLIRLQQEQAASAAFKISQFIKEIEGQIAWTTHLSWSASTIEQRQIDGRRLLRQVPAITELTMLDGNGREQLHFSRQSIDRVGRNTDLSDDPRFKRALASRTHYGPVYLNRESEPFMTLGIAGARRDFGVSIVEVNLKHIWDVVSLIRVGQTGRAYVVDAQGRLIAHPNIALVLRNIDLSHLAQVKAARAETQGMASPGTIEIGRDLGGQRVLTAHARALPLDWLVFVELSASEADAPLYDAVLRSALVVFAGLGLALLTALLLARRMVVPIRALTTGAAEIGAGALDHRIEISTRDELEALGDQFNRMASQLQTSYSTLEGRVVERTRELATRTQQLAAANVSKTRFLAAASHDLRQPLHALNLFVAQLRAEHDDGERRRLTARIDSAVTNINELFNALLDITKLDAGVVLPNVANLPVASIFSRLEANLGATARDKGLRLRIVPSSLWARSDPILLERILLNLVSNAVRYTSTGGIVIGCRRMGEHVRIDVCDSGVGIPVEQQEHVFDEFYQVGADRHLRGEGLGLGLAIVERLCGLLEHPIELESSVGRGTRFSVTVPIAAGPRLAETIQPPAGAGLNFVHGKLIVVIDDDKLVLEAMGGLLTSWGCSVVAAETDEAALRLLNVRRPHLVVSDFRLAEGRTGIEAIGALRRSASVDVPAFLVSGDISAERLNEATAAGLHLLHKPVSPMTLRAMITRLLRSPNTST
jgi:signal transduction histidine kinase/CheY-like chemotaxis protein